MILLLGEAWSRIGGVVARSSEELSRPGMNQSTVPANESLDTLWSIDNSPLHR